MFRGRIKITGEVADFNTFKNEDGETMVQKNGSLSFFRPEEVENVEQAGWHPASELPPIKENGKSEWLVSYVECDNDEPAFLRDTVNVYYDSETKTWLDAWGEANCVEWWSIPPKKDGEL